MSISLAHGPICGHLPLLDAGGHVAGHAARPDEASRIGLHLLDRRNGRASLEHEGQDDQREPPPHHAITLSHERSGTKQIRKVRGIVEIVGVASHEVSVRVVVAVVRMLERVALPTDELFAGLPFRERDLRRLRRISWDDYVTICDNAAAIVGGPEALSALLEDGYHAVFPELRQLGRAIIEPKAFVRFVLEVIDPIAWPALRIQCEDLGTDMCITARIRPGARPNPTYMRASVGALRGITRHLDLPPVKVLRTDLGADYGIYWVRLPESRTLFRRASRASRAMIRRIVGQIALDEGELDHSLESRLDDRTVDWDLSRRQIDVLRLLVEDNSNAEIARALDCTAGVVESQIEELLKKSGTATRAHLVARFWGEG
jgi:DNA-binding CsgD family transcriptional regulator